MQIVTFGAVEIGSYSVSLEIFEISRKFRIRSVDTVRYRLELGKDAFTFGKISAEKVEELCKVLQDFAHIMEAYHTDAYRACATSALREAENSLFILDAIRQRSGLQVEILSNSEQRFLSYKSIASREDDFNNIIEKGTAIVDIDGGSLQLSLFDKDALVTTQNIRIGNLRIREKLAIVEKETTHYEQLVEELIRNELISFKKMHLKDRKIENIVLVGDYFTRTAFHSISQTRTLTAEQYLEWYHQMIGQSPMELAVKMGIPGEYATVIRPALVIYKKMIEEMEAKTIWLPSVRLSEGIAYEYGEKKKLIKNGHNFENDIVMAAKNFGKRYAVNKPHTQNVEMIAVSLFDSIKKIYGMGSRERLLLRLATMLHDCGKYVSLSQVSECTYNIIMATEIIGLSHREREMIATIAKCNTVELPPYEELSHTSALSASEYLVVAKLTAILRFANSLDRSHLQKIEEIRTVRKEEELHIYVTARADMALEQGLMKDKAEFFNEVFSLKPVLKIKRSK